MLTPFAGLSSGEGLIPAGADPQFLYLQGKSVEEFRKAVTSGGYVTDVAQLVDGGAVRLQSIERTLIESIQREEHYVLFNMIAQSEAGGPVDEFSRVTRAGSFPGGAFNAELGVIPASQGKYERDVLQIKYLMDMREVSSVVMATKNMVDMVAKEKMLGTTVLKTSVEWGLFYGNASCSQIEFDGLFTVITRFNGSGLVIDARGKGLSYVAEEVINAAATIRSYGHFGIATDLFCSPQVKSSEFDQKVDPAFRVMVSPGGGSGSLQLGTPVEAIKAGTGKVAVHEDIFIEEGGMPWEARPGAEPELVTDAGLTPPTAVVVTVAGDALSQFADEHAGNYYWAVESGGQAGRSTAVVSAQHAVAAGQGGSIAITNPADANVTHFWIHRSRRNGTGNKTDLRQMFRVPRQAGATTTWVDENAYIPGTSAVFILDMRPMDMALTLRRLLPMTMFPLYPTNKATKPWAQLFYCAPRIAQPERHAVILNVLPKSQTWRPF